MTKKYLTRLTYDIVGAAIEVHKHLGPGLLESVYQKCLVHELELRAFVIESEFTVPLEYKGFDIETELRCDMVVDDAIIVELKSVKQFEPIYDAQLLTYMKMLRKPKGILFNFNVTNIFNEGQKTFVNEFYRNLPEE
jgi:GxxExxY protein